jgi:cell wall-associated NlpC family hydrolase
MPEGYTAPLLGRMWCHGVLDCYSLIRDWYRLERGIVLPDFTRSDEWWLKNQNLYVDNFRAAGFTRIVDEDALQPGDVLLMQIMAPVPNHGAVYLGDGIILHHLHGRLSCREVWGGYYKKHTTHILRHDYAA